MIKKAVHIKVLGDVRWLQIIQKNIANMDPKVPGAFWINPM